MSTSLLISICLSVWSKSASMGTKVSNSKSSDLDGLKRKTIMVGSKEKDLYLTQ